MLNVMDYLTEASFKALEADFHMPLWKQMQSHGFKWILKQ